ncbi:MAG: aminotransferase class I/II-fold pyridoxal phosphate-dependent enzyme [Sulfurimonas sp.]
MNIKKLFGYLPSYPHYKMNVFSGTNNFEEIKNIYKKLSSKKVVQGEELNKYNESLKNKLYSKHIYTFASGRMGFYSILKSIGITSGDEVIIPSFTCIVVPNAILYSGAKPIYCDIKEDDFNIDVSKIEKLITSQTKVLYAQHTFGQMCAVEAIMEIAKKYNLLVIEDAALALGAKKDGKYAGTIGDFGYYSTDRSKVVNTGLGGVVSVNNMQYLEPFNKFYEQVSYLDETMTKKIAKTFVVNILTLHPKIYWLGKFVNAVLTKLKILTYFLDEPFIKKEDIVKYPYPARLSNLLANIGISQIESLDNNIKNRRNNAQYFNDILKIYTEVYMNDEKNIFLRYSFLVQNRDYWEEKFSSKIDLSIWFKTVASGKNDNFQEINYEVGSNKVSEFVCEHIFNLPTHNNIKPEELKKLLHALKNSGDIITRENIL